MTPLYSNNQNISKEIGRPNTITVAVYKKEAISLNIVLDCLIAKSMTDLMAWCGDKVYLVAFDV